MYSKREKLRSNESDVGGSKYSDHNTLFTSSTSWPNFSVILGFVLTIFAALRPKLFIILIKTLPRDLWMFWVYIRAAYYQLSMKFNNSLTIHKAFRKIVKENPNKIAVYFEEEKWTFEQVDRYSNRIGHYFKNLGYKKGESITLLLDTRPEYLCIWLGLSKVGVITALVNTNIVARDALAHAIKTGKSSTIIFGSRFRKVVDEVREIMPELKMFQFNDQQVDILKQAIDLKPALEKTTEYGLDREIDAGKHSDTLVYIYTSGTTGLPKASIITHVKVFANYYIFNLAVDIKKEDILYIPLPLYHTMGGIISVSQCLCKGTTLVLRTKFSASNYWKDLEKYKCTMATYIGELARYVVLAHQNAKEKPTYRLQKMFGNGMKPSTWRQVKENFNVDNIYEFYGSTEGNFGLFNVTNKVGAVGSVPIYAESLLPIALIKCNEAGEPLRNEKGFFQRCECDEPGLLVFKISNMLKFEGYSDEQATKKKILENVLKKGDHYFNTGDVLVKDDHGYIYFKDRTGDTFRWKGENVSTTEVEDIISHFSNRDVAVYGVEIPGNEGKAGMVSIADTDNTLDFTKFLQECQRTLPPYAIPVFVRVVDVVPQTGTFKIQKAQLQKDGFNINVVKDKLYFLDSRKKEYVVVNSVLYNEIVNCTLKI